MQAAHFSPAIAAAAIPASCIETCPADVSCSGATQQDVGAERLSHNREAEDERDRLIAEQVDYFGYRGQLAREVLAKREAHVG